MGRCLKPIIVFEVSEGSGKTLHHLFFKYLKISIFSLLKLENQVVAQIQKN